MSLSNPSQIKDPKRQGFLLFLVSLVFVPFMISNQSFWLDEGGTALYAVQPTLAGWLHRLLAEANADCQMPLPLLTAWLTARVFGVGELALRSQNYFWAALTLFALFRAGQKIHNPWLPAVMIIQPFFWFYTDQARQYAPQIALGSVLLYLVTSFPPEQSRSRGWLISLFASILCIYSISMLCAVVVITTLCAITIAWPNKFRQMILGDVALLAGFIVLLGLLSAYYVSTLLRGAEGTRIWPADLKAFSFIFYEWFGCLGLGPSLDSIREHTQGGTIKSLLPQLLLPALLPILLLTVEVQFFKKQKSFRFQDQAVQAAFIVLTFAVIMIAASFFLHKPLWARHFSPALPFLVLIEAACLQKAVDSSNFLKKLPIFGLVGLLIFSSIQIRTAERFYKDDYRRAAEIARKGLVENKVVWWSASEFTGEFYQVSLNLNGEKHGATVMHGTPFEAAISKGIPDLIIATRPEVYDPSGAIAQYVSRNKYLLLETPKNFRIYAKPIL